ncbi:Cupin domain protein [Corynebacterium atrinae]|nr:Cupin domain protein [Corynebacterium atrinae]
MAEHSVPTNSPDTFGDASVHDSTGMTVLSLIDAAPSPKPARPRPAVQRLLQGDGANLIVFSFAPGQDLPDHQAAHPITVQCLSGTLDFTTGGEMVRLKPGMVVHLRDHIVHRVDCPPDAPDESNILLLTMLTGERHPDS